MSFRLFVYYCALCGGWAAFVGWLLGELLSPGAAGQPDLLSNSTKGMFLGLMIAMGLGFIDAFWVLSWQRLGQLLLRVLVAVLIGGVCGLLCGMIGHLLFDATQIEAVRIVGWTLTGILCAVSVGSFDILASAINRQDRRGARAKFLKCLLGGTLGGIVGAVLALFLRLGLEKTFGREGGGLRSPTALGFVALGACTGVLVGLAQVILKEAWIRIEAGFRPGREMILAKEKTSLGRAEGSDIALFGDAGVEKLHALIVQDNGRYLLEDNGTPGGTFINDQRVNGRTVLQSGDQIRLGRSVLRFYEKQKRR